ncbi:MAG: hypothetical protein KDG50_15485 [Chromatiales bacterium]|nr:hypothetical protein [Chromatiales bacterium]
MIHRIAFAISALGLSANAVAGPGWVIDALSVPVDSPLALLGLAAVVGLIAARLIRNRGK